MFLDLIYDNMDYIQVVILGTMIVNLLISSIKEKRNNQPWNWVRTIVICAILSNFLEHATRILHYEFGLLDPLFDMPVPITGILSRCIILFGMVFVAYVNEWDSLILLPAFYLIASIVFKLTSGINEPFELFFDYGGLVALILIFEIVIRVKDNNALGLGIFYLISFGGALLEIKIFDILSLAFGIFWSTGKFTPFKKRNDDEEIDETQEVAENNENIPADIMEVEA